MKEELSFLEREKFVTKIQIGLTKDRFLRFELRKNLKSINTKINQIIEEEMRIDELLKKEKFKECLKNV